MEHQKVAELLHLQEPELVGDLPVVGLLHYCCYLLVCSRVERVCAQKWEGKVRFQVPQPAGQGAAGRSQRWLRVGAGVQRGQPEECGWAPAC